jgi:hypothetical protein
MFLLFSGGLIMPGFFEGLNQLVDGYNGTREIYQLIQIPRDEAMQVLRRKIAALPRSELEDYQDRFAQFSCAIMNAEKRVRAMELYTILHLLAFAYYQGEPLGFCTDGRPLA